MKNTKEKKNILVTGGSGFLGIHVVESLLSAGYNVRVFDSKALPYEIPDVEFIMGDMNQLESLIQVCAGVETIFHLAALANIDEAKDRPLETMKVNVIGTANLLEAACKNKVNKVIFSSSIYVHSRTGGFYRVSKHSCELLLEEYYNRYGLNYNILRFGTLYGPHADENNSIYYYLKQALFKGEIIAVGSGDEIREYIDVRDAADTCVKILKEGYHNETLILSGNYRMRLSELLEMISEILDNKVNIEYGRGKNSHYKYTPYSYNPKPGKKIVMNSFRDMGQGLVEILEDIDNEDFLKKD